MSDLISRQKALQAIVGITTCENVDGIEIHCDASVADSEGWLGGVRDALRAIEEVPSAEPERKKGKWIYDTERVMNNGGIYSQYHCSECGFQSVSRMNFCGYCGAEMRGER